MPDDFDANRDPLTGGLGGCVFGAARAAAPASTARCSRSRGNSFRARGGSLVFSGERGLWSYGVGAGYAHRRYHRPADPAFDAFGGDRGRELSASTASLGRQLSRTSEVNFDAYRQLVRQRSRRLRRGVQRSARRSSYSRSFLLERLQLLAALGLYHSDDGTDASTNASALAGLQVHLLRARPAERLLMYTEHYGLTGQPFQLTPDARFWFDSRTHRKAMAYLGYGLAQGEGFIVVTGEIGAGKSTLVAHLLANIDRARLNAISLVSTQVEGDDMLRLVAQGLGLDTGAVEKARLLDAVEQRLEEELRAGKRTLLIVDEAQNLPVSALEELRMLSNFQVGGRALLQIVAARPARIPRQARRPGPRAAAPARHRHPPSRRDGRGRGRAPMSATA